MNWFILALQKYFDFTGRATRSEYWYYVLFYVLIGTLVSLVAFLFGAPNLNLFYAVALLTPTVSVTTRRLHDAGQSGWMQVAPVVLTFATGLTGALALAAPVSGLILIFAMSVFGFIVSQGILLYFLVKDSNPGVNRFGQNPKMDAAVSTDSASLSGS